MLGLDWSELMIIAVVAIVIIGPRELPKAMRGLGKVTRHLQSMAGDFRKQFDEAMKEAELDDVKKTIADVKKLDPTAEIRKSVTDSLSPMSAVTKSLADTKSAIQSSISIAPVIATSAQATAEAKPIVDNEVQVCRAARGRRRNRGCRRQAGTGGNQRICECRGQH